MASTHWDLNQMAIHFADEIFDVFFLNFCMLSQTSLKFFSQDSLAINSLRPSDAYMRR